MKKLSLLILSIILLFSIGYSQNKTNNTVQNNSNDTTVQNKTRPVQVTYFYPIGTNGIKSYQFSNHISLNVLFGYNGGVGAVEIASLANINKGNIRGLQASGLFNITKGDLLGFQTSGLFNLNIGETKGLQSAGLFNTNIGNTLGSQISGILNVNIGNTTGLQAGGVLNTNIGDFKGIQIASNLNFNSGTLSGGQVSNVNINIDSVKGFQIGLLNYAKQIKGFQVGLVNVSVQESDNIIPIGLISIVKGGLQEIEITGGEVIYASANFKLGVPKFYTIYKIGYTSYENAPVFTYGLGFGSEIAITEKHKINIDFSSNTIMHDRFIVWDLNMLNKFDLNYKYSFNDRLSVLVGPSFNHYISQYKTENGYGTLNLPYTLHEKVYDNTGTFTWVGLNIGASIRL